MLVAAAALVFGGCGSGEETSIEVFAASSLTNAFEQLIDEFETDDRSAVVRLNTAGSSALREQLRDGADANVFASANETIVDELVADETIQGAPVIMATNRLVLAVPEDNPGQVSELKDLTDEALLIGVCAPGVPCGDLAQRLFADQALIVEADTEEPDVRSLTRRLVDGELDAALIYASDAVADAEHVTVVGDELATLSTRYPIVSISADDPQAQAFIDFVLSDAGQAILVSWGFGPA